MTHWTIGLDADDTLWHNERFFQGAQERLIALLADYTQADHLRERLEAAERRNHGHYGFGVKGFTLSMIETAIEVTDERVPATIISQLIREGQDMLAYPIELLTGVADTVKILAKDATLILITKGDLLDQESKLARSGLGDYFDRVEVVSDKTAPIYERIFRDIDLDHAIMVGNSLPSDVIPALEAGLWGVHIPHDLTWSYEQGIRPTNHPKFRQITTFDELPILLKQIT